MSQIFTMFSLCQSIIISSRAGVLKHKTKHNMASVLVRVTIAVIKYRDQKYLGEERAHVTHSFMWLFSFIHYFIIKRGGAGIAPSTIGWAVHQSLIFKMSYSGILFESRFPPSR